MRVLVVAAHPDDEVLGCGGTIPLLVESGHQVYVCILGEGATSRSRNEKEVEQLRQQCREVGKLLRIHELFQFSFPDNCFDTIPLLDIIKQVERVIRTIDPTVVYTHHAGDLNIDHQIANRAVLTAVRPVPECSVLDVYAFETVSSTEWSFQQVQPIFTPNVFVDISKTLNLKLRALEMYKSEVRQYPHPRSTKAVTTVAHRWGNMVGLQAAEVFQLIRSIKRD